MREIDAIVEQLRHLAFVFDLLDDQLEVEIVERALELGGGEGRALGFEVMQEGLRLNLDEAEGAIAQGGA